MLSPRLHGATSPCRGKISLLQTTTAIFSRPTVGQPSLLLFPSCSLLLFCCLQQLVFNPILGSISRRNSTMPSATSTTKNRDIITKLTNCRLVKGDELVTQDLWMSSATGKILRSQQEFYSHHRVPD